MQGGYFIPRFSYSGEGGNAFPVLKKGSEKMSIAVVKIDGLQNLEAELEFLRTRLDDETENALKMRVAYEAECREFRVDNDAKILEAKQELDVAESRIAGLKAEVAEKERLLDGIQGREADENRRRQGQQDFELANQRLAESRAELEKLTAEYRAMPDKIGLAEWQFHQALRAFNDAKSHIVSASEY